MSEIASQDQLIAQLQARIEVLEADVQTLEKARRLLSADLTKCVQALAEVQTNSLERIKLLEYSVFPKAAGDLVALNKIVPFNDEGDNPLDRRKS